MKDPITGKTVTEKCLDLLRRPEGATLDELVAVTGWKKTSVGGFIQNAKKKYAIQLIKPKTYAIVAVAAPVDEPVEGEAA